MNKPTKINETFIEQRNCLHCGLPLSDQTHATRKFCLTEKMEDGTVKSCKDDFHMKANKEKDKPFQRIADYHREQTSQLEKIFEGSYGNTFSGEYLDKFKIDLRRSLHFEPNEDGANKFYYIKYVIIQISNNQFKIESHESKFQ